MSDRPELVAVQGTPGCADPLCTRINGECVSWHCPHCGDRTSSQGHAHRILCKAQWGHPSRYDQPAPAEYLDDPEDDGTCPKCGGRGGFGPDRDGQYDPCDACEGTGLLDFERGRPHA